MTDSYTKEFKAPLFPDQPIIGINHSGEYFNAYDFIYFDDFSEIRVPAGFEYDGASVPRLAWSFMPPDGLHRAAALIHDYLYVTESVKSEPKYNRKQCDNLFYEIMIKSGVSKWRAFIAYKAVRIFGGSYWNIK